MLDCIKFGCACGNWMLNRGLRRGGDAAGHEPNGNGNCMILIRLVDEGSGWAACCAAFCGGNPRPGISCKAGIPDVITLVASALPSFLEFPLAHPARFA